MGLRRLLACTGVAGLLVLALVGCATETEDDAAPPEDDPVPPEDDAGPPEEARPPEDQPSTDVTTTVVASGLEVPWDVAFTEDGRAFVTERDRGVLSEVHEDGQRSEVASFPIDAAGEGGLLGVAASPDFTDDETLFVYTTTGEDNRILRVPLDGEPQPILTGIPRATVHNGGRLAFGPDGTLYASTGDAGDPAKAADGGSLAGKILRLTPAGSAPDDNPTPDSPVYARGIRNAQGLAWDADGMLYITEFGPGVDDAILRVDPGSDQGWNTQSAAAGAGGRDFPDPVAIKQPPEASWSGAGFLHDGAIPQWEGGLFVAALRGQRLWRFTVDTGEAEELLVEEFGRLRHATQAPDGSLWVLTSNRDGRGNPQADDDRILRLGPPG